MAFTDNPVVSQLMGVTGLNDLISSAATPTPTASPIGAVSSQTAPKSPQYRPEYQQARPPVNPHYAGPQGVGAGSQVAPSAEPGVMSAATLQSPTVHDLLGYYGVSAPQNIDDHLFIHDPQAFANHPMIANMIEQGLGGLANYHTGQDTAQTLSNIAGSVLGNQAMHQQAYNARAMAPLMQAQQIQALMQGKQRMALEQAQADEDTSRQNWYDGQYDNQQQLVQTRKDLMTAQAALATSNARSKDNSPAGQFNDQYHTLVAAADPEGKGNEDNVSAAQKNSIYTKLLADTATAQAAGKKGIQDTKNTTSITVQGMKNAAKGANGTLDAGSRATDAGYKSDLNKAQDEYGKLQKYMNADPAGRLQLLAKDQATYGIGDDKIPERMNQLAQQAHDIHIKRAALYARRGMTYGAGTDAAPAAAPAAVAPVAGNPYRTNTPQQ